MSHETERVGGDSDRRRVFAVTSGQATSDGAGVRLRRYIGSQELDQLDPFLLLDFFESPWVSSAMPDPDASFLVILIFGTISNTKFPFLTSIRTLPPLTNFPNNNSSVQQNQVNPV